jgi:FtsH-binding integral membrane protein
MLLNIPVTIAPLIVYNLVGLGLLGDYRNGAIWNTDVFSVGMVSGATFTLELGYLMVLAGLVFLFIEIVKATHTSSPTIFDHAFSMLVFIIYLIEFIAIGYCATSVFFILTMIALIDVVGGFTITIRASRRDFGFEKSV